MLEKIKSIIIKKEGSNKKNLENLVVFLILLIIVIIAINTIWKEEEEPMVEENVGNKKFAAEEDGTEADTDQIILKTDLEASLENILQQIKGVEAVSVLITYGQSSELQVLYDESIQESTTEETDTGGGKRVIEEKNTGKTVVFEEQNGEKVPITQKVIMPEITGAIITARGAANVTTKTNITQAVEAATGLPIHKIQVFEMK